MFLGQGCVGHLTTERSFDSQATCVIDELGLFSVDVCTTRHWWKFGRLVKELNVCTVGVNINIGYLASLHIQLAWMQHTRKRLLFSSVNCRYPFINNGV